MSTNKEERHVPFLLWPFYAIWRILSFFLELTGRVLGVILGLILVIAGIIVSLTIVGAVIGIPLAMLGIMLMIRGLF